MPALNILGSSSPDGKSNLKRAPVGVGMESVAGLKSSEPENANAVAISGDVTKE